MNMDDHNPVDSSPVESPEWRALIESAWESLRRKALGLESAGPPVRLSELSQECQSLAAVTAWYENHGNITRAALRLGTTRRALRERLKRWRKDHPHLCPPPPPPGEPSTRGNDEGERLDVEGYAP